MPKWTKEPVNPQTEYPVFIAFVRMWHRAEYYMIERGIEYDYSNRDVQYTMDYADQIAARYERMFYREYHVKNASNGD